MAIIKEVAVALKTGWDWARDNKRVDPRVAPGIGVPGHEPIAETVAPAVVVAPSTLVAPSASSSPAPQVQTQVPAAGVAPVTPVPVVQKLTLKQRLQAALASGEKDLEKILDEA